MIVLDPPPGGTTATLVDDHLVQFHGSVHVGSLHPGHLPSDGSIWVAHGHGRSRPWQKDGLRGQRDEGIENVQLRHTY